MRLSCFSLDPNLELVFDWKPFLSKEVELLLPIFKLGIDDDVDVFIGLLNSIELNSIGLVGLDWTSLS